MHFCFNPLRTFVLLASALVACVSAQAAFTVSGRQLLKDGQPFQIRGVCYNPTPIGDNGFTRKPNGDYFTSGYADLQERDLPLLRAMGANTIRIYGWAPGSDHTAFLDKCYNNGVNPIYVLVNYWIDPATDWTNTSAVQAVINQYVEIETRLNRHPAVLGVLIGNEVNQYNSNGGKSSFWAAMNKISVAVKAKNPARLTSVAITDNIGHISAGNAALSSIDFWSMQIYRYPGFGTLFSDYAARSTKPLLISEYGYDAFDNAKKLPYPDNAAFPGQVVAARWKEIAAASTVTIGGCVFEWSDEWFKVSTGTDTTQEPGGFATSFPDRVADEEWWGLFAVQDNGRGLDILSPRQAYHQLKALWTAPVVQPPPPPVTTTPTTPDYSFESLAIATYQYRPSLPFFTFAGDCGIAANYSAFTTGNPVAPDGTHVAFVQRQGAITLSVPLSAGTYTLSAMVANRAKYSGTQTVAVRVNGQAVGTFNAGTSYVTATTSAFTVTEGTHAITFTGQSTTDSTLFLDKLQITAASVVVVAPPPVQTVTVPTAGFEAPALANGAYQYRPATVAGSQEWTFAGNAGVAANGSAFTSANPAAPEGRQVAFIQRDSGLMSQTLTFAEERTYTLTLKAAHRGSWNQALQTVQVLLNGQVIGSIKPSGSTYQAVSISFSAPAGSHTLTFKGTTTGDGTLLLDQIVVQ